ncbi:MAG: glycosyltransferase family 1 protein [Actinomycetota bacterium]
MGLRVAIDVGPLHGPLTGVGRAVDGTVGALADRPRDVTLGRFVVSTRARLDDATRRLPVPAMLAHRWWARSSWPPLDPLLRVDGRSADVVHGTNYVVPPTTRRIARLVSVYDCWFLDEPDRVDPDVGRAAQVLLRSLDDGAHVVTCSDATKDALLGHVPNLEPHRVTTIHLGPPDGFGSSDPRRVSPPTRLGRLTAGGFVLSLGTVERRKNVPGLVEAFGRLAAEVADVRLVIAGSPGDDSPAVDAAIRRLESEARGRIDVVGRVDGVERDWLLDNARALAYPSLDEGFGFPILEAQQNDLPIAATAVGSIPEVGGPSLLLSRPDDTLALAANLHRLVTDDGRHAEAAALGRRNLERFSWQRCGDELITLYRRLAGATS